MQATAFTDNRLLQVLATGGAAYTDSRLMHSLTTGYCNYWQQATAVTDNRGGCIHLQQGRLHASRLFMHVGLDGRGIRYFVKVWGNDCLMVKVQEEGHGQEATRMNE